MAAPTWLANGSPMNSTVEVSLPWPGVHQTDDYALALLETANEQFTPPAPWVTLLSTGLGTPGATDATRVTIVGKRAASGSEPNLVLPSPGNHIGGRIIVVRGAITVGSIVQETFTGTLQTPSTAVSIGGGATSLSDCLILMGLTVPTDVSDDPVSGGGTNPDITVIGRTNLGFSSGNGGGYWVGTAEKLVAGSFGATSLTLFTAAKQALFWLALKSPDSAGAPGAPPIRGHIVRPGEAVHRASRW